MDRLNNLQPRRAISIFLNITFLLLISFYIFINVFNHHHGGEDYSTTISNQVNTTLQLSAMEAADSCEGVHEFSDQNTKCAYVKSNTACRGKGYIDYLQIFYCSCGETPAKGYISLLLWVVLLFYLLANTSAEYFCPSVESLCEELKLSPTIAGTTLLPFGNGANDVFASIISFTQSSNGDVGLNSVLGGAFFVSCFVVGVLSMLTMSSHHTIVDERSFIRDVLFLIFSLSCLLMIITFGRINIWVAICFVSIYFVYISTVSAMQILSNKKEKIENPPPPAIAAIATPSKGTILHGCDEFSEMNIPLLGCVDEEKAVSDEKIDQNQKQKWSNWFKFDHTTLKNYISLFVSILELPLSLPRRLTIPIISEEKWCKPLGLSSAMLAPVFLAALVSTQMQSMDSKTCLAMYMIAGIVGIVLGNLVFVFTKDSSPPKKCVLPWLLGGFFMSITWTYLLVEELVASLVAIGTIFEINPSILGLTVLAWGNSVADLISNVAMALHGGPGGTQIAMSSCYAGPLFNTLMGLGLSLVFASWSEYPSSYVIPGDPSLYETIGFFICGLLWAAVVLPKRNMQLDKFLGGGLFAIYFCFLFLRLAKAFE